MTHRSKLLPRKVAKDEQELHIFTNPFLDSRLHLLNKDDYQTPLTASSLSPKSKWIIVRNNIHQIRTWGGINASNIEPQYQDWYLFFQVRRELRRAQQHIRQIENQPDFAPIHHFNLPIDENRIKRYDVSHVQSSDALYHPGFGSEPVVLQSLLYYFSEECTVPYTSIFRPFLTDICSIVNQNRRRLNKAAVFRRLALILAIVIFTIIILMLFSLVLSVLTTTFNLKYMYKNNPAGEIEWHQPQTDLGTTFNYL